MASRGETYQGQPCRKCGGVERHVSNKHCVACVRAQTKAWKAANREEIKAQDKKWRAENVEKLRASKFERGLKRNYGLSLAHYNDMIADQAGQCAVCYRPLTPGKDTVVDHCHATSKVRGILHSKCNTLLGFVDDDPSHLESAAAYLRGHNAPKAVRQREFRQRAGKLVVYRDATGKPAIKFVAA